MKRRSTHVHPANEFIIVALSVLVLTAFPLLGSGLARGDLEELFPGVTTLIAPYSTSLPVNVDGVISGGEYNPEVTWTTPDTGISISLAHDNESLFVGISGPTWSWIALGISSDQGATMGFVFIVRDGDGYDTQLRSVMPVAEQMVFAPVSGGHGGIVDEIKSSMSGGQSVAELQLSLDTSLWTLQPGIVYPTVMATNLTTSSVVPAGLSGDNAQFMGSYLLRQDDNVNNVNTLFNGKISQVPGLVAVVVLAAGTLLILMEFVLRRRKT